MSLTSLLLFSFQGVSRVTLSLLTWQKWKTNESSQSPIVMIFQKFRNGKVFCEILKIVFHSISNISCRLLLLKSGEICRAVCWWGWSCLLMTFSMNITRYNPISRMQWCLTEIGKQVTLFISEIRGEHLLHQSSKLKQTCHRRIDTCSLAAALKGLRPASGNFLSLLTRKQRTVEAEDERDIEIIQKQAPKHLPLQQFHSHWYQITYVKFFAWDILLFWFSGISQMFSWRRHRERQCFHPSPLPPPTRQLNSLPIYSWYTFVSQLGRISKMRR